MKTKLFLALTFLALTSCTFLGRTFDFRTIDSVLKRYEQTADPKPVTKFLFRHRREVPERAELAEIARWAPSHRIYFIRLLDKLNGEWKQSFISSFSDLLRSSPDLRQAFLDEYADTKAPSVRLILNELE